MIYRLPRGKSLVKPRSSCPKCGKVISWHDNIPLLSYLLLRGRCRGCSSRIPLTYFAVELLSGALAVFAFHHYGISLEALWIYVLLSILLIITFIDWFHKIIPDVLSLGGIILGWAGSYLYLETTFLESILGSILGAGLLVLVAVAYRVIRKIDGLGGGDIKLMAMIGAFLGWQMVFPVLFLASFMGSIYGLYLIRKGGGAKTAVAFGSFLSPAAFLVFCFGRSMWEFYMKIYPH